MPTEKAHGVHMMKMCEAFASLGIDVEFVVPYRFGNVKDDPFEYYSVQKNFIITKVFSFDFIKFIPRAGFWLQYLSFVCFTAFHLLFTNRKNVLIYTREYLVASIFQKIGFRTVYEAHRVVLKKKLFFWLLKNIDTIITNSKGVAEEFIKKSFKNVLPYPNGVDPKAFNFNIPKPVLREKGHLPKDKKIIMYIGHLYNWKGIDTLVEAARLFKHNQNLLFICVGGTDMDVKKYKEKIKKIDINNILFLGHKRSKEVPYYLRSADVLILPNNTSSEESVKYTSPMKLFEYMASGIPIVASDLPSIREVLNENNSVLVRPDDARSLIEGIKTVLLDKKLAYNIAKKAYEDVRKYTWENRAKKILDFLNNKPDIRITYKTFLENCKKPTAPLYTYIYFPLIHPLSFLLFKLGFTANGISILSILTSVVGAYFIFKLNLLLGLILFLISYLFDFCDGNVARIHYRYLKIARSDISRKLGLLLENLNANISYFLFFLSIGYYFFITTGNVAYLILTIAAYGIKIIVRYTVLHVCLLNRSSNEGRLDKASSEIFKKGLLNEIKYFFTRVVDSARLYYLLFLFVLLIFPEFILYFVITYFILIFILNFIKLIITLIRQQP